MKFYFVRNGLWFPWDGFYDSINAQYFLILESLVLLPVIILAHGRRISDNFGLVSWMQQSMSTVVLLICATWSEYWGTSLMKDNPKIEVKFGLQHYFGPYFHKILQNLKNWFFPQWTGKIQEWEGNSMSSSQSILRIIAASLDKMRTVFQIASH